MKKIIFLIIFNLSYIYTYSQYQWVQQVASAIDPKYSRVISDGSNGYIIGHYRGDLYLPNDTISCLGFNDIFIAKFDANGNELWAKTLGNFNQQSTYELAKGVYDPVNNCIYVAGSFINYINFGNAVSLTSAISNGDIFIARMELDGTFTWAKKGGGLSEDYVMDVRVSPSGIIYMITQSSDSSHFENHHLAKGGTIIRYDALGNLLSAELKFSAPALSSANVFLNFIDDDLVLYGAYKIAPFTIDTATLITNGDNDAFLARADSMGHIKWIRHFGNAGADRIQQLVVDVNKNLLCVGNYTDSINLGGGTLIDSGLDIFVAKFDQDGNSIWAKKMGITGTNAYAGEIQNDSEGGCYFTGSFSGTASFENHQATTSFPRDMFLTRYDSLGNCYGVEHFGETFSYITLAKDNSGSLFVNGNFVNTINIGSTSLTSLGSNDIFLTKMDEITKLNRSLNPATNQLTIYANPNKGICNITVPDDLFNEQNIVLTIYNSTGNIIQQQQVHVQQQKISINIAAEAAGIYTATLGNDNKMYSGKIIFE